MSDPSKWNDSDEAEPEISLADIVEFIQESWKQLVLAGIAGAVLGFGGWYFLGSYKAELLLLNKNNISGLDLATWLTLQKSLPNLANQRFADKKISPEQIGLYQQMREPIWWSSNVIPTLAITKVEAKDLVAIGKDPGSAPTSILGLNILASANSKEQSLENVRLASLFLKTGGAFLQVKSLLNSYEGEVALTSTIQSQITGIEIDQTYLREQSKSLNELNKRFPQSVGAAHQFMDLKDSGAKFLPITSQLIAINSDINKNNEKLMRLYDRLNQISLLKTFLLEAESIADQELDGILLSKSLLIIEEKLRKNIGPSDLNSLHTLDQLRAQLVTIEVRFSNALEAKIAPSTKKTGMLKTTAAGIAIAGFLMLAFLLGRKLLSTLKPSAHRS